MFYIEIRNNITLSTKDDFDTTIVEAIQTIYENEISWIVTINWNGCIIPLSGGAISYLYESFIDLKCFANSNEEFFTQNFLAAGFTATWECKMNDGFIYVRSIWYEVSKAAQKDGNNIDSVSNRVIIKKDLFINELQKIITKVQQDLHLAGYDW